MYISILFNVHKIPIQYSIDLHNMIFNIHIILSDIPLEFQYYSHNPHTIPTIQRSPERSGRILFSCAFSLSTASSFLRAGDLQRSQGLVDSILPSRVIKHARWKIDWIISRWFSYSKTPPFIEFSPGIFRPAMIAKGYLPPKSPCDVSSLRSPSVWSNSRCFLGGIGPSMRPWVK